MVEIRLINVDRNIAYFHCLPEFKENEAFDLEIPDAEAEKVVTVGDVVEYIKENVG